MRVVHLTQQGAVVRAEGELLLVEGDGVLVARLRLPLLQRLVVHGSVHLTAGALARLLASECDVVFVSLDGRYKGRLERPGSTAGGLRAAQALASVDPARRRELARAIVRNKLHGQYRVLRALRLPIPEAWRQAARQVRVLATVAELAGAEGWATRAYFSVLRERMAGAGPAWRRRRRPPPDAVNAVLSYVYALVYARVFQAVLVAGLDPYIGFLHATGRGRPSLVLDVMEELRPLLGDWLAVRLLDRLGPADGWAEAGGSAGVRLSAEARRTVVEAFELRLKRRTKHAASGRALPWEEVIERQAEGLARAVRSGSGAVRPVYPAGGGRGR